MRPDNRRVLVVGTTADYIEWIRTCRPGEALFLTDADVRRQAEEPPPAPEEEVLCDLSDERQALEKLARHLDRWGLIPVGVACYDCESMALAARLAGAYVLPYPSLKAVENCRDKYRSRVLWQRHHLETPRVRKVRSAEAAVAFLGETGGAIVLKPLNGSGSELIFRCDCSEDCRRYFRIIDRGLEKRRNQRLYRAFAGDDPEILAETYAAGKEFSCDFVLEGEKITLLRLAEKVLFAKEPFGTASAYVLPGTWPDGIDYDRFHQTLYRSAKALGIDRAVCMLDFILRDGEMILLEMAPRPGGDCLPPLVRRCCQMDVLQLMLDFARGPFVGQAPAMGHRAMAGLRLHADREGVLKGIDDRALRQDTRFREIHLSRKPGHRIRRPPEDYDAWLLGHVIFEPDPGSDFADQCREVKEKLLVEIV